MNRILTLMLLLAVTCLTATTGRAQTKVFKEIGEEISSQMKVIEQDGALVGYIMFTQLEKASEDSFNYKVAIMDENLNDIGTVNFKEKRLNLREVSFEGDVLCLGYLKSNFIGVKFKNRKQYNVGVDNAKNAVFLQFLNMNGKIVATHETPVMIGPVPGLVNNYVGWIGLGTLKNDIQLRNIAGKGFALYYADDSKRELFIYNTAGEQTWHRPIKDVVEEVGMLTSGQDVWLLEKKNGRMGEDAKEGGFEVIGFDTGDSSAIARHVFKDKFGNSLKILTFDNDPVTGKPFASGLVIDPTRSAYWPMGKYVSRGYYFGCFTMNFTGHRKGDVQETYSYWADGSQPIVQSSGYFESLHGYPWVDRSFRDYEGNTYFAGSLLQRHFRVGAVCAATLLSPTILAPLVLLGPGTNRYYLGDALILKQTPKGVLSVENSVPGAHSARGWAGDPIPTYDVRSVNKVTNSDTKTNFLVIDDPKNTTIYNVNLKKVVRTIPHRDGQILTSVYPAKEGHVMVSEYNKKVKEIRMSIETL